MWIERVKPEFVGDKGTLPDRLRAEGLSRGWHENEIDGLLAMLPTELSSSQCFLDKLTGIWRYEFGRPHTVDGSLVWGTHMWAPAPVLLDVLVCARLRLPGAKLPAYLKLLTDLDKHQEYLAEMFPLLRVDPAIPAEHEVSGRGAGNKTIDWSIAPAEDRYVLIDVKRRFADFIAQMNAPAARETAPPEHDPALLLRSIEQKFIAGDPDAVLQGAWIVTDIKQEQGEFELAFSALDPAKVHFVILGDHQADIHLLVRREQDRAFLMDLFKATPSGRFVFTRKS
jgi:hypothetical protein